LSLFRSLIFGIERETNTSRKEKGREKRRKYSKAANEGTTEKKIQYYCSRVLTKVVKELVNSWRNSSRPIRMSKFGACSPRRRLTIWMKRRSACKKSWPWTIAFLINDAGGESVGHDEMRRRKRQYIKPCLFISYHIFYVHPWDISRISRRGGYQKRYQGGLRELKRRSKIFFDLLLF